MSARRSYSLLQSELVSTDVAALNAATESRRNLYVCTTC